MKKTTSSAVVKVGTLLLVFALAFSFFMLPHYAQANVHESADTEEVISNAWWNDAFSHRIKITFDTTETAQNENLINFPALVQLTGLLISYDDTQDQGQDIRFLDSDNATQLPYEIELWDETGISTTWVKVPQIDKNSDADHIWMYYGNPDAEDDQSPADVWDEHYLGVWHLNQDPMETIEDSTDNDVDGTGSATLTSRDLVKGALGNALSFGGEEESDRVQMENSDGLDTPAQITVEAFAMTRSFVSPASVLMWRDNLGGKRIFQLYHNDEGVSKFYLFGGGRLDPYVSGANVIPLNEWYLLIGTYDGSAQKLFINGEEDAAKDEIFSIATGSAKLALGRSSDEDDPVNQYPLDGILDEVRVSNVARSVEWIAFEYCNMAGECSVYAESEGNQVQISDEETTEITDSGFTFTWTTDKPATSRVVYGTSSISDAELGESPNYGYPFSTDEADVDPKVISHSVAISDLESGTMYYFRAISSASPETVGGEMSTSTAVTPTPSPEQDDSSGRGTTSGGSRARTSPSPEPSQTPQTALFTPSPVLFVAQSQSAGINPTPTAASSFEELTLITPTPQELPQESPEESEENSRQTATILDLFQGGNIWWWFLALVLIGTGWYIYKSKKRIRQ